MAETVTLRAVSLESLVAIPLLDAVVGPGLNPCGPGLLGVPSATILANGYGAPGSDTHYYIRLLYPFEQDVGGSYGGGSQQREGAFLGWENVISWDCDIQHFLDGTGYVRESILYFESGYDWDAEGIRLPLNAQDLA